MNGPSRIDIKGRELRSFLASPNSARLALKLPSPLYFHGAQLNLIRLGGTEEKRGGVGTVGAERGEGKEILRYYCSKSPLSFRSRRATAIQNFSTDNLTFSLNKTLLPDRKMQCNNFS